MPDNPDLVVIGENGEIRVIGQRAKADVCRRPGRYRLLCGMSGMLVLSRESFFQRDHANERVLMAGEIINSSTMVDLISMITAQQWFGDLQVVSGDTHRVLLFDRGTLRCGQSTDPADRLDRILVKTGVLTNSEVESHSDYVTPTRRLGEVLVDAGALSSGELYEALKAQMEQIFLGIISQDEGRYLFSIPHEGAKAPPFIVHMRVDHMLLKGVEHIDEMALFRKRIPHGKSRPVLIRELDLAFDSAEESSIISRCTGRSTIEEIARETGTPEFECTKVIYEFLRHRYLGLEFGFYVDEEAVRASVTGFNSILREIRDSLEHSESVEDMDAALSMWVEDCEYARYLGRDSVVDGVVDPEKIILSLQTNKVDEPIQLLYKVLHELTAFAILATTLNLPSDDQAKLVTEVNRRLAKLSVEPVASVGVQSETT